MARQLRIYGLVQGVYYRHSTVQQASALGLQGWVCNRLDGSVEALVCGNPEAVQALIAWAHSGPPAARVDRVEVAPADPAACAALAPGFVQTETR